ncbi:hypothetical protein ACFSKW_12005 [Nonomuraea mangrovi]|uniref:Tyr recombinase domain-containing protein n=1 Tax=Nonomuraea mangrovi TaxID=2316207 RepID=A0ABW4SRQ1_9ACTN
MYADKTGSAEFCTSTHMPLDLHEWNFRQAQFREYRRAEKLRRGGRRVDPIDAYIPVPRPSAVMVWTPEQTRLFLEEASQHRLFALYRPITLRGLRRGEMCGLRWKDVDLDAGTVNIAWQLVQLAGRIHEGRPKTDASMRTIALDAETIAILPSRPQRRSTSRRWLPVARHVR